MTLPWRSSSHTKWIIPLARTLRFCPFRVLTGRWAISDCGGERLGSESCSSHESFRLSLLGFSRKEFSLRGFFYCCVGFDCCFGISTISSAWLFSSKAYEHIRMCSSKSKFVWPYYFGFERTSDKMDIVLYDSHNLQCAVDIAWFVDPNCNMDIVWVFGRINGSGFRPRIWRRPFHSIYIWPW